MKLSAKSISLYMARVKDSDKKAVAQLLVSGNPAHVRDVPKDLLAQVEKEIASKMYEGKSHLVKKAVRLPGTDIILEAGDRIQVLEAENYNLR